MRRGISGAIEQCTPDRVARAGDLQREEHSLAVHLRKAVPKAVRRRPRGSGVQGHTEHQSGQKSADSGDAESCTGPETDCRRIREPLLARLPRRGKIRPDPLFLGLHTSDDGAVIDRYGEASTLIFTLGPLRKGSLWEKTAVPEIRVEAAKMADLLLTIQQAQPPSTRFSQSCAMDS